MIHKRVTIGLNWYLCILSAQVDTHILHHNSREIHPFILK